MSRFGLIGHPLSHSQSPSLFAEAYGEAHTYELIDTTDFNQAWNIFLSDFKAVNVTMPFKEEAAARADFRSPEVQRTGAANILVKTERGIEAHNSDYLALVRILNGFKEELGLDSPSLAVIGMGGAGKSAFAAAEDCGFKVVSYHHDEIAEGVRADVIVYTLPKFVEGASRLHCRILLEANYRDPALSCRPNSETENSYKYVSGLVWLREQAKTGFEIMTGI